MPRTNYETPNQGLKRTRRSALSRKNKGSSLLLAFNEDRGNELVPGLHYCVLDNFVV